jgi:hypothetical protein
MIMLVTLPFFQAAIAEELTPAQQCAALAEYAAQASQLRLDGVATESAAETLLNDLQSANSGIPQARVRGVVQYSYMAKMKPADMRNYYLSQCKQGS